MYRNEFTFEGIVVKRQPKKDATGVSCVQVGQAIGVQSIPFYPNDQLFAAVPEEGQPVRIVGLLKPKQNIGKHNNVVNGGGYTVTRVEAIVPGGGLSGVDDPLAGGKAKPPGFKV